MNATAAAGEPASERICALAAAAFLVVAPVARSPGLRVALLAVAVLALLHLAFHYGRDRVAPAPPAFLTIPLVLWAALAAASVAWSVNPAYSLSELRPEILYAGVAFCVFYFAADERRIRLWGAALLAGTVALAFAELTRALIAHNAIALHSGGGRFTTHLVMAAPFLLLLAIDRPAGLGRRPVLLAAGIATFFVAAFASENRIVWIAFLVSLATLLLALAPFAPQEGRRRRVIFAGLLAAGIATLFAYSVAQKAENKYPTARSASESLAMDLRPRIWTTASNAIMERPLAGHGFGHEILLRRFRAEVGGPEPDLITHGHNMFLNATVSLGAAGLVALVLMMAALTLAHVRNLSRPATRVAGAIGLALVAGFIAKNLTDDFFYRHNALVFWALNGMLIGFGQRTGAGR